ncbi:MAG TPA: hypothetical protein PLW99_00915 [Candidatus Paceibacterota bacterium]|nr:hypothetical protein [Candidatus Paceibacterota bacterium]
MLFTEPPDGLSLEEVHQAIAVATARLNGERAKMDVVLFAQVYVGPIVVTPGREVTSFIVSYSDKDADAPVSVDTALKRLIDSRRRDRWWYPRRDCYCA